MSNWPTGRKQTPESIRKRVETRARKKLAQAYRNPAKPGVLVADMVVVPGGDVGMLMELNISSAPSLVMFVNNGPRHKFRWRDLRRATRAEVEG